MIDFIAIITFVSAVFFLLITPGPGVLSTAGVGSAFGYKPGLRYLLGLMIGQNLVLIAVATGLSTIMLSVAGLRQVLLVLSVTYLGYLAFKIATAGSRIAFIESSSAPGLINGIMLQTINPKAYAVNTTLYTGFPFAPDSPVFEVITKLLIINVIWLPIHLLWLAAGVNLKKLALTESTQRSINILMAASMLIVVGLALFS